MNDKVLSDVELVVLSKLSDQQFTKATDLIEQLDEDLPYWNPQRATIYPLLHRLSDQALIEKNEGRQLEFKRTSSATTFLSSLLSSRQLLQQFDTTTKYLELLAQSMISVDPYAAKEFLEKFADRVDQFSKNISNYQLQAENNINTDGWEDIEVE